MRTHRIFVSALALALTMTCWASSGDDNKLTPYVDTSIGTGDHGHVFVGANVPFGFVQLGPTSIPTTWDWTSGYHASDSTVIGFSHTHLSGTGIGDLFDVTVMPVIGDVTYARGTEDKPKSGLWSYADRSKEVSKPGYYSVPLLRYGIKAELSATTRTGIHRYTFPKSNKAALVIDLENGGAWDKTTESHMEVVPTADGNSQAIKGWRYSTGWAKDQKIYFYAEVSKPFTFELCGKDSMYARLSFKTTKNETVLMKVGLSAVSMEGAQTNLLLEQPGWDFDGTVAAADKAWNEALSKVRMTASDSHTMCTFYTALYHTMIAPSVFDDADGRYRGADGKMHDYDGFQNYTTFSLWDTYRAQMPLMTIIHPEKVNDMVNTMLHIYDQQGKLPVWHLMGCETDCMVGNPGIPPVADAITKGFDGFDHAAALKAMVASADKADRGQDFRIKYGYIPCDLFGESVAYDMEYAIADGALAMAAEAMANGETHSAVAEQYRKIAAKYKERSHSYRNFFDPSIRFMRGKDSKGAFRTPFNPISANHRADDYCEGNAWQYTWLAPHDLEGLINCFGSKEAFVSKLDSLFTVSSEIVGLDVSPDISGLIGQYAHGNEPSHHILYYYTMIGQPWKTADKVRQVLTELYHDRPNGLSGNEDVGQMSAWYLLSAMGFYQVEPAGGRYWFGSPVIDKAELKVRDGVFTIDVKNNSAQNKYIQSVSLNGKQYKKPYINYEDIAKGGTLTLHMGTQPTKWYADEEAY